MTTNKQLTNIVCLDRDGLPERIQIPVPDILHQWMSYSATAPELVIERSQEADILVVNKVKINQQVIEACPKLKHIAVTATGYNVIDIEACKAHGISVSNVPSYAATTVSEHVIGCAIVLRREILRYAQSVANSQWQKSPAFCLFGKPFQNLADATLGLIGFGEIARATADRAHALGMRVIFCSRSSKKHAFAKQVSLEQLLRQSDIVSLHCDLNESTEGLIGKHQLQIMPKHSILINTARGGIVDESAAAQAIKDSTIAGLAFDVFSQEPPNDSAPLLSIADQPNVIITPHIAWASEQAMQFLADTVTRNIEAFCRGAPINIVT